MLEAIERYITLVMIEVGKVVFNRAHTTICEEIESCVCSLPGLKTYNAYNITCIQFVHKTSTLDTDISYCYWRHLNISFDY